MKRARLIIIRQGLCAILMLLFLVCESYSQILISSRSLPTERSPFACDRLSQEGAEPLQQSYEDRGPSLCGNAHTSVRNSDVHSINRRFHAPIAHIATDDR